MAPTYQIAIKKVNSDRLIRPVQKVENSYGTGDCKSTLKTTNDFTSFDCMNKQFEGLRIDSSEDKDGKNVEESGVKILAGTINNVIQNLDTVLVKPHSANDLLYLGTLLYLCPKDQQSNDSLNYVPLGYIDDIFGSIAEPLYCVNFTQNSLDVQIGAEVYYHPNHPCTQLMYVKRTSGNNYIVPSI